jgi:TonB family protein
VKDPSGAVVANAPVTLTNTDTKAAVSTVTTDQTGKYVFANFDPGTYSVTIRALGFKTETQTGIQIAANDTHNGGVMFLQLGAVAESVSITGSRSAPVQGTVLGPMTTLAQGQPMPVGNVLSTAAIDQSVNGRDLFNYTRLIPGPKPQRVGGMVTAASLVNHVIPVYPAALRIAGVLGTVKFEATIGKDGTLRDLKMVSSPDPGLTQAALDAVKNWQYKAATLNGEPVEVLTTIDANFMLQN